MKKIIALLLAAAMAFSLMACSGSDEEPAADSQNNTAETTDNAANNGQTAETAGDAKSLPQVALKELTAKRLEPVASARCEVTDSFNGTEIAGQVSFSHVGFIRGQWSDEDVFVVDNPTDYYISLELRLYPLDANGQRGQSYSRLSVSMQPQSTTLITSASLGFIEADGAYDMELTVTEVPEKDRAENLLDQISFAYTANAGSATLTVDNLSENDLNVRFTTLLLKDGEVVYLDANRTVTHKDTATALAAGETGTASFSTDMEFNACAVAYHVALD